MTQQPMHGSLRIAKTAFAVSVFCLFPGHVAIAAADEPLRIATFSVDATPELGSPLAYDPMVEATQPLQCKGIVLLTEETPIVLCAVDWLGVANASGDAFRQSLAAAVETSVDRVVVHALHQHDAPRCDLTAAGLLAERAGEHFDVPFIYRVIAEAGIAARNALDSSQAVTSISATEAVVEQVASNRRMLGPDGVVHTTRYTACRTPAIRALPEGVVDPKLRLLTFNGEHGPVAALTFYATHPQSYYRTGGANPDFPGMARNAREAETGVFHLHFNGAGGNIGAGKYNDGSRNNRHLLAGRMAAGMKNAWERRTASESDLELDWSFVNISPPLAEHLSEAALVKTLQESTDYAVRSNAAAKLAFLTRIQSGVQIQVSRLRIGMNEILFMPGELFVEYQLAAQAMKPERNVMLAAYGEYGTQYIGTRVSYSQGGYEVSERATNVSPEIEGVLLKAMRQLLGSPDSRVTASDFTERTGLFPENN